MNDTELDTLLRAGAPATAAFVSAPEVQRAAGALRDAILAEAPLASSAVSGSDSRTATRRDPGRSRRRRAGPRRIAMALCGIGALGLAGGIVRGRMHIGPEQAWSASAVRFAESSPRLLIGGTDYSVSRATQSKGNGEMAFVPKSAQQLRLVTGTSIATGGNMNTGATYQTMVYDAADVDRRLAAALAMPGAQDLGTLTLPHSSAVASTAPRTSRWFHQSGTRNYRAIWTQAGYTVEYRLQARRLADAKQIVIDDESNIISALTPRPAEIQVTWMAASEFAQRIGKPDTDPSLRDLGTTTAAGRTARWFAYRDSNRYRAMWIDGRFMVEVDGLATNQAAFADVLRRMHAVDVDTWLSAMPASVVKPLDQSAAIDALLRGVPLPPAGWQANGPSGSADVQDQYQLAASVYGGVTCSWIDEWLLAQHAGDAARVQRAATALKSSRSWPGLVAMSRGGDYADVVWEFADVISGTRATTAAGGKLSAYRTRIGGTSVTVPTGVGDYRSALGCDMPASK